MRLQKQSVPVDVCIEELAEAIEQGRSICPAVMNGTTASNWEAQQLFLVDIDNEANEQLAKKQNCSISELSPTEKTPLLTIDAALTFCKKEQLPVAMYYPTFSSSSEKPKFRLGFIMDKPVICAVMHQLPQLTLSNILVGPIPGHGRRVERLERK